MSDLRKLQGICRRHSALTAILELSEEAYRYDRLNLEGPVDAMEH